MTTTAKHLAAHVVFAVLALAPAAVAQEPSGGLRQTDLPSIRVSYADLNVESPAGMQTLTARINGAVRRVCPNIGRGSLDDSGAQCRYDARRDAWRQFEHNQARVRAARGLQTAEVASSRRSF